VTIKKEPSELRKALDEDGKSLNLTTSIDLVLSNEGDVEGGGWCRKVGKVTVFTSGAAPIANKLAKNP
jgi:hypothetical protein